MEAFSTLLFYNPLICFEELERFLCQACNPSVTAKSSQKIHFSSNGDRVGGALLWSGTVLSKWKTGFSLCFFMFYFISMNP
jgi:hypothetical protein